MRSELDPVVSIRIPKSLLAEIDGAIDRQNKRERRWYRRINRTSWILTAIRMRLGKRKRNQP